jgi:GT2 family glycosyltransferase
MRTPEAERIEASSVAAVVVTYNRQDTVAACLDGIRRQTSPAGVIIAVDNASTDATGSVLASHPDVHVLRLAANEGFAGGLAAGLRRAEQLGFDWAWLFNDDDRPRVDALEQMISAVEDLPRTTGMLACVREDEAGAYYSLGATWNGRHKEIYYSGLETGPVELDVVTFQGTLVSMQLVAEIGVPRADFFMMLEDLEYCLRCRSRGWKIFVLPKCLVTAANMGSTGRPAPWRGYYQTRNHLLMVRDHHSWNEGFWWAVRTAKFIAAAPSTGPGWMPRVRLRLAGARDGWRMVTGRTVHPS